VGWKWGTVIEALMRRSSMNNLHTGMCRCLPAIPLIESWMSFVVETATKRLLNIDYTSINVRNKRRTTDLEYIQGPWEPYLHVRELGRLFC